MVPAVFVGSSLSAFAAGQKRRKHKKKGRLMVWTEAYQQQGSLGYDTEHFKWLQVDGAHAGGNDGRSSGC